MSSNREAVIDQISQVFLEEGVRYSHDMLKMGVMDVGVDSMTYAILVARLESSLGFDPFTERPNLPYPTTLEDFVDAYDA